MLSAARTRAEVDISVRPRVGASLLDRLPTDFPVEILQDLNDWVKIKPGRLIHGVSGYVPKEALTFPVIPGLSVFPDLLSVDGLVLGPSVPPSLKVTVFLDFLAAAGKPAWILEEIWSDLDEIQQSELIAKIRAASAGIQPRWDDWVAGLVMNLRIEDAVMDEWLVILEGGREMYALRDHYIYMQPVQDTNYFGCALKGQIMRWTGMVRWSALDGKRKNFYEVEFFRMSRFMRGWFRADILTDYHYPLPNQDPAIEGNSKTVFDLSHRILRHPQDDAITEAKNKGYSAAQYIDVFEATHKHLVHYSLCGQFCVAALGGMNVMPLLKKWLESNYPQAAAILADTQLGTTLLDLQSLLGVIGLKGEIYSSIPTSPQLIKERLNSGQFVIAGCGINSIGKIKTDGKIRHWVIIEDVLPTGNSGWVRIYNPFSNQEEVYNYNLFITSAGVGAGLWVYPNILAATPQLSIGKVSMSG